VQPTVFTDVKDDMTIMREEIFGPVMTIARFSTLDEVVRRANDTKFGLAAGVFTKDIVKVCNIDWMHAVLSLPTSLCCPSIC